MQSTNYIHLKKQVKNLKNSKIFSVSGSYCGLLRDIRNYLAESYTIMIMCFKTMSVFTAQVINMYVLMLIYYLTLLMDRKINSLYVLYENICGGGKNLHTYAYIRSKTKLRFYKIYETLYIILHLKNKHLS